MRQVSAIVIAVEEAEAVLELPDGTRRTVAAPDQIHIMEGMSVNMVERGNEILVVRWGS